MDKHMTRTNTEQNTKEMTAGSYLTGNTQYIKQAKKYLKNQKMS